jgi:dipeptidyl aminopeptidase/acylaminoacyl peptidase
MSYTSPGREIEEIVDAPLTPRAVPAPGGEVLLIVHYEAHPPIELLARPFLSLGGIRVDPVLRRQQRTRTVSGLSLLSVADGRLRDVELPAGVSAGEPIWAPDGRRFAFPVDDADGVAVWTGDVDGTAAPVAGLRLNDVLGGDPPSAGTALRWSRDGRSLLALAQPASPPPVPTPPIDPHVEETSGKRSLMATYQDLLRTDADGDAFEALATCVPVRVDPATGDTAVLGPPGLYRNVTESPDGAHLLVHTLRRPFSFRVPFPYFARRVEVWSAAGDPEYVAADIAPSEEVPRQGVPVGPRLIRWLERSPATLIWTEALDGGDPVAPAEHRDQVMTLAAPFAAEPEPAVTLRHRCSGWIDTADKGRVLLTEYDRDRRWYTTWLADLGSPAGNRVIFDLSVDDDYASPGTPMTTLNPDGTRTTVQDGSIIYLRGEGARPDGLRPFLDRLDLTSAATERLYESPADGLDRVIGFAGDRERVLLWHEGPTTPPNVFVTRLDDGAVPRRLSEWPDPHPMLTGMTKRLLTHDRGDGVGLSGMLLLPPGHDPERDGRLPLVIWAYPLDYGDAATAGQVRDSEYRFTRLTGLEPGWFVLRGYAVLASATMPVIGDPETKNDTYVEQIAAAAAAHIRALDEAGVIDPDRVAVGGHSYGAFMTANLLAHTGLFAAGIARSGAYNRTLTPFGFQTERRSLWEAREVYDRVSPLSYADTLTTPLLLIHGEEDGNSGTFPVQSERLFQAVQGNGGTARLVLLPHEDHGYIARESVLHVLAEQFAWLDRWLGPRETFTAAHDG